MYVPPARRRAIEAMHSGVIPRPPPETNHTSVAEGGLRPVADELSDRSFAHVVKRR